jgi:hypothetical protein
MKVIETGILLLRGHGHEARSRILRRRLNLKPTTATDRARPVDRSMNLALMRWPSVARRRSSLVPTAAALRLKWRISTRRSRT